METLCGPGRSQFADEAAPQPDQSVLQSVGDIVHDDTVSHENPEQLSRKKLAKKQILSYFHSNLIANHTQAFVQLSPLSPVERLSHSTVVGDLD